MTVIDQEYRWKRFGPTPTLPTFSAPETAPDETPPVDAHAQGYEAGFAEGEAAGRAAAEAREQQLLKTLEQLSSELTRTRDGIVRQSFEDMADVMRVLFEQLFLYELRAGPELLTALCQEMQKSLQSDDTPRVMLSTDDFGAMQRVAQGLSSVELAEDANLPVGVMRAKVGRSVAELDVIGNLQDVFTQALLETPVEASDFDAPAEAQATAVSPLSDNETEAGSENDVADFPSTSTDGDGA